MAASQYPPLSVVLLAHNEAETIGHVIREFMEVVVLKNPQSELIVAEDGSTDGTKRILLELSREYSQLMWDEGQERRGYVVAFKEAMNIPGNELIVFCDASGKHKAKDVFQLLDALGGADLVVGKKIQRKDPIYRTAISWIFNRLVNVIFSVKFSDIDCPLRLFRKSAFADVAGTQWRERHLVNFEMVIRFIYKGYQVVEVPVSHLPRKAGTSRGLPLKKIPGVILSVLKAIPLIYLDVTKPGFKKTA